MDNILNTKLLPSNMQKRMNMQKEIDMQKGMDMQKNIIYSCE